MVDLTWHWYSRMSSTFPVERFGLETIPIGRLSTYITGCVPYPYHRRMYTNQSPAQETNNLEWYRPDAITTQDGSLVVTLSQKQTHNLNYQGGI